MPGGKIVQHRRKGEKRSEVREAAPAEGGEEELENPCPSLGVSLSGLSLLGSGGRVTGRQDSVFWPFFVFYLSSTIDIGYYTSFR